MTIDDPLESLRNRQEFSCKECCCTGNNYKQLELQQCEYYYNIVYRPCAADIRMLNFLDIYRIMSGKRMVVSIAFSRKSVLGIMSRQYVVQFQLGTTRLLRFIDFLLAVERTQQIMDSTALYCIVSCHSKWWICRIFPCWIT